jgi:lipopolysaccharide/colanic/teichoic acid biosynthesis glycosyltransferase
MTGPQHGEFAHEGWDDLQRAHDGKRISVVAVFDFLLAGVFFILWLPVILLAILSVKLTSPGPVIYRQTRVGRKGRLFTIYKLRSMWHDCERHTGAQWATHTDPRVTPVGQFLRRTHLDELPQFWNVLKGDMSLVGPRPERPEFVAKLQKTIPRYRRRESVRPGVTGLAQVQLPPDTDHDSVRRKLACDLYYIKARGLWLDLRIVTATALVMIGVPGFLSCRWLRIPSVVALGEIDERRLEMPTAMSPSRT